MSALNSSTSLACTFSKAFVTASSCKVAFGGEVHPNTAKEYKLKQRVYVFELDLQKVIELPKEAKLYTPVSKYPSITRDIALAVSTAVTNQQIEDCIRKNASLVTPNSCNKFATIPLR